MKIKTFTNLLIMIPFLNVAAQQNSYSLELNIKTIPTEKIKKNETEVGFFVLKNIDNNNAITNTIKYKNTSINYDLKNYNSQDDLNQYNRIENNLIFSHQVNKNNAIQLEVTPIASFESDLTFSDISLLGGMTYNHFFNSKNSISLGVKRMDVFGQLQILPAVSFYHKINQNAFIDIGFPNSKISYSNNIRNTFNLTNSFNGGFYNLDNSNILINYAGATKSSFSQMSSAIEFERNLDTNWFLTLKGGYEFNKKYILTDTKDNKVYDFNIDNGYFLNIGIKYKH